MAASAIGHVAHGRMRAPEGERVPTERGGYSSEVRYPPPTLAPNGFGLLNASSAARREPHHNHGHAAVAARARPLTQIFLVTSS